jgi:hypothetical protein
VIPSDLTAHPNLLEVVLPGGGRAWVRRKLSHEQALHRQCFTARLADLVSIDTLKAVLREETLDETKLLDVINPEKVIRGRAEIEAGVIASCAWGWDGVLSPDGDELVFPTDVGRMDEDDFRALYEAQEGAIREGRADPNAGAGRSSPPLPAVGSTP